jgi:hypothetical protein
VPGNGGSQVATVVYGESRRVAGDHEGRKVLRQAATSCEEIGGLREATRDREGPPEASRGCARRQEAVAGRRIRSQVAAKGRGGF